MRTMNGFSCFTKDILIKNLNMIFHELSSKNIYVYLIQSYVDHVQVTDFDQQQKKIMQLHDLRQSWNAF